jgi:hypothetical protein
LNSGWNCDATNHGWSLSSTISTSRPSGDWPLRRRPADLEPVAVPLVDDLLPVDRSGLGAGLEPRRVQPEAHRAALVLHVPLVGHEVDHRVLGEHVELGRVDVLRADHLPSELDHGALETEAQPEIRNPVVAGEMGSEDLALDAAVAEAARDEDPRGSVEPLVQVVVGERL